MADISNKTLAILVGVAIVISVIGILSIGKPSILYITGAGTTDAGNVSVNLTEEISVQVAYNINFGNGRVAGDNASATLQSNETTSVGGTWTWTAQYIRVENDGTVNETLNVSADTAIDDWLGGTAATNDIDIIGWVTEANACSNATYLNIYRDIQTANADETLCPNLGFGTGADEVNTSVKLVVPSDAETGQKDVVLTFTVEKFP